jgi:hypothetical protein
VLLGNFFPCVMGFAVMNRPPVFTKQKYFNSFTGLEIRGSGGSKPRARDLCQKITKIPQVYPYLKTKDRSHNSLFVGC